MRLLSLAARNLMRNTRRSLITGAAIALGLSMMMFTINLQNGQYQTMLKTAISGMAGHVVVQAEGWQDEREEEQVVTGSDAIVQRLRETFPDAQITPRILIGGLVNSPTGSTGIGLKGVDPVPEAAVDTMDDKLLHGEWIESDRDIVIGVAMAETLSVEVGDKIVYMGQHAGDEVSSRMFRVKGIFKTGGPDLDSVIGIAHIDAARELLARGDVSHQIAVHLPDATLSDAAAGQAAQAIGRDGLDVMPWPEALPELVAFIKMDRISADVMMAVIGLIVAMGVLNTVLMSVLERVREFGVLMAIGMRPRRIATVVLLEGAVLGLLASLIGILMGIALSYPAVIWGLDYTSWIGESMEMEGVVISAVMMAAYDWDRMALYGFFAVLFTVFAAAYPATYIARLTPVDALRHQ